MTSGLSQLVQDNRPLFWSIGEKNLDKIDDFSVVETILNFGDLSSVKELFEVMGLSEVSQIFYSQLSAKRNNYYPQVSHFFDLYFTRHVQKHS